MERTMSESPRESDIPVRGGTLHVGEWGPASGAAVIAVHGITASHRAWATLAATLPGVRLIAPDLRGRGNSNALPGPFGMTQHAEDLVAMMDALGIMSAPIVGHSMGGFVALVASQLSPDRFPSLLLVDGGLPLDLPAGASIDTVLAATLGPAAARLSMTFASEDAYLEFWAQHPAFAGSLSDDVVQYALYDLHGTAPRLHPSSSIEAVAFDSAELYGGEAVEAALDEVHEFTLLTAPRGLLDQTPGIYDERAVERWRRELPLATIIEVPDVNHYTIVMSAKGAEVIAARIRPLIGA
jgi:lipase